MSGRDGTGPRVVSRAPADEVPCGQGTAQRIGDVPPRKPDRRTVAVLLGLLGLVAAVAPAALSPTRASAVPATVRDGPTCPSPPGPGVPQGSPPASSGPSGVRPADCDRAKSFPGETGGADAGTALPWISADPGQPLVAAIPAKLTGSKLTMSGLRLEGIVQLPTADGPLTALKFSMHEAVTEDVVLRPPGPPDRTIRLAAVTARGDVALYATRFVGRLPGFTITLAPDLPVPAGVPIMSPGAITFTDPAIDLAFVKSDTFSGR